MRRHAEQPLCPRNGNTAAAVASLRGCQAEPVGEGIGDPEQRDGDRASPWGAGIARQPLSPGQPPMRPLWTRQGWCLGGGAENTIRRHLDLHPLAAYQIDACAPLFPTAPVAEDARQQRQRPADAGVR